LFSTTACYILFGLVIGVTMIVLKTNYTKKHHRRNQYNEIATADDDDDDTAAKSSASASALSFDDLSKFKVRDNNITLNTKTKKRKSYYITEL
jgi:hypothetical protein